MRLSSRLIPVVAVAVLTAPVVVAATQAPLSLLVRYGPGGRSSPREETRSVGSIRFVIYRCGYARVGWEFGRASLVDRILGVSAGRPPRVPGLGLRTPRRWATFDRGFAISRTEITNAQYEAFDPEHPRAGTTPGDDDPVTGVSWLMACRFCDWLSRKHGIRFRLPTEAEWEVSLTSTWGAESVPVGGYRGHRGAVKLRTTVIEWCHGPWAGGPTIAVCDGYPLEGDEALRARSKLRVVRGQDVIGQLFDVSTRRAAPRRLEHVWIGFRVAVRAEDVPVLASGNRLEPR